MVLGFKSCPIAPSSVPCFIFRQAFSVLVLFLGMLRVLSEFTTQGARSRTDTSRVEAPILT